MSKKFWRRFWVTLFVVCLTLDFYLWIPIVSRLVRDRTVSQTVKIEKALRYDGDDPNWDFCVLKPGDKDVVSQLNSGVNIPSEPVAIGGIPTARPSNPVPIPSREALPAVASPSPTAFPTQTPEIPDNTLNVDINVRSMGGFDSHNYHIVFVGMGYVREANSAAMEELIGKIQPKFSGIHVDFAYVEEPINFDLVHVAQNVDFKNTAQYPLIWARVKAKYPALDNLVFVVFTPEGIGTQDGIKGYVIVQGNDPNSPWYIAHEIGHMLGLGDGYQAVFRKIIIPNSELFYKDSMPKYLATALTELKADPPLYKRGTCDGRELYSYFDPGTNLMVVDWTDASSFNPLQVTVMNDYIKGKFGK